MHCARAKIDTAGRQMGSVFQLKCYCLRSTDEAKAVEYFCLIC